MKPSDLVQTIFGLVPRHKLDVTERVSEDSRARTIKTEWTLREDFTVSHEGEERLLEFVYPPQQNADGSPISGTERVVRSVKGELARADCHVMAKTGIFGSGQQGFLNS